ncbi:MAG: acetylxylan esterase [Acidobacteria bacterium]|nr:acetylxylan esterase [Acidobacteriota bacterium]
MKHALEIALCAAGLTLTTMGQTPPSDAFQVFTSSKPEGPSITAYLQYQTEMAWRDDDQRRKVWEAIRSEQDLLQLQQSLREHLLDMLGGLPEKNTPLNPQVTGKIRMDGFYIEKLIFQSLPGVYVSALLYVPEDGQKRHPAVLVPSGHAADGKAHYQALCQRLALRGYLVIAWDPVGQGERSQFWNVKSGKSRYNLICGEHAILGNLAYLAGANLARWETWDGIRALDYLLTRPEVDPERINITGTSGGGFQAAHIAALDPRIKVAAPSCYITLLPMRVYNRIFQDPDSDPEQDLYGMISNGVDHPGLLLMMYPRPVFVAAAVLDFFPIEGTHDAVREVTDLYTRFGHPDHIAMHEGYHGHQYSPENQEAAFEFLDHFNGIKAGKDLPAVKELDAKTLQCTRSGQVMVDYSNARSLMAEIRDYYEQNKKQRVIDLKHLYYSTLYPGIKSWTVSEYGGAAPAAGEIRWERTGGSDWGEIRIERYLLHHSRYLRMPLLWIHKSDQQHAGSMLLWLGDQGKATAHDWPELTRYLAAGYQVVSVDPRGLGETRMAYRAVSPDDPVSAHMDRDQAYVNPLSGVLADYVYNSILTGRPYLLQMIEDVEVAKRFIGSQLGSKSEIMVTGVGKGYTLARLISETLDQTKFWAQPNAQLIRWSHLVDEQREVWPIELLIPGGAYID